MIGYDWELVEDQSMGDVIFGDLVDEEFWGRICERIYSRLGFRPIWDFFFWLCSQGWTKSELELDDKKVFEERKKLIFEDLLGLLAYFSI